MSQAKETMKKFLGGLERYVGSIKNMRPSFEVNPGLTFLGLITFSLGKIEFKNPEEWDEAEEKMFAKVLRNFKDISMIEFREILRQELNGPEIEKFKSDLIRLIISNADNMKEISSLIFASSYATVSEFEILKENEFAVRYEFFVGREDELKELHKFLSVENPKLGIILGRGGVGKTRLALEFAKNVEKSGEWDVFFVRRHEEFVGRIINKDTLLILDEPSRYDYRGALVDFVLNQASRDHNVKLLLIDRAFVWKLIKNELKLLGESKPKVLKLGKGNIKEFLEKNFEWIDDHMAEKVDTICGDSFVYAIFCLRFLQEGHELNDLEEILAFSVTKYINDYSLITKLDASKVRKYLSLISLIQPVNWLDDKDHIKDMLFESEYDDFGKLLSYVKDEPNCTDLLVFASHLYLIRPDSIADYIASECLKEEVCKGWISELIRYMPFRIPLNIAQAQRNNNLMGLLNHLWEELNKVGGETLEYFKAIVFFYGGFSIFKSKYKFY